MALQITEKSLIQRINRKLAHESERLYTTRGAAAEIEMGRYYILDNRNFLVAHHVKLIPLAKELGVLGVGEEIVDER